jgi:hypothetical protein
VQHGKDDIEGEAGDDGVLGLVAIDRENRVPTRARDEVGFAGRRTGERASRGVDHIRCRIKTGWAIGERPATIFVDEDRNRLVAILVEVLDDRSRRCQRHLVLARAPAIDDTDPESCH